MAKTIFEMLSCVFWSFLVWRIFRRWEATVLGAWFVAYLMDYLQTLHQIRDKK